MEQLDGYILPVEAGRVLGCHARTVARWLDEGKIAGVRTPFGRLVKVDAVMAEARRRRFKASAVGVHTPLA